MTTKHVHYRCLEVPYEEKTIKSLTLEYGTTRCCECGEPITQEDDGNALVLLSREDLAEAVLRNLHRLA